MVTAHRTWKDDLPAIAHDAMLQRGLLPDQLADHATAAVSDAGIRDLRGLRWASIDMATRAISIS